VPLHLAALRPEAFAQDRDARARVRAVARAVADLFAKLAASRFVHRDLSLKNLLLVERPDEPPAVVLVDLDGATPGRRFTQRRLLKALAQLGDLPERVFGRGERLRWLADLCEQLERTIGTGQEDAVGMGMVIDREKGGGQDSRSCL